MYDLRNWNGLHAVTRDLASLGLFRIRWTPSCSKKCGCLSPVFSKHVELHAVRAAFGWFRVYAASIEEKQIGHQVRARQRSFKGPSTCIHMQAGQSNDRAETLDSL